MLYYTVSYIKAVDFAFHMFHSVFCIFVTIQSLNELDEILESTIFLVFNIKWYVFTKSSKPTKILVEMRQCYLTYQQNKVLCKNPIRLQSVTWWVTDRLNIELVMRSRVTFTVVAEGWKLGSRRKIGMLADWGNSPTANCPKAII